MGRGIRFTTEFKREAVRLERVRHRQNQKGDSQGAKRIPMSWVKGGQPWMTRPYSEDLRERLFELLNRGPLAMRRRSNLM